MSHGVTLVQSKEKITLLLKKSISIHLPSKLLKELRGKMTGRGCLTVTQLRHSWDKKGKTIIKEKEVL